MDQFLGIVNLMCGNNVVLHIEYTYNRHLISQNIAGLRNQNLFSLFVCRVCSAYLCKGQVAFQVHKILCLQAEPYVDFMQCRKCYPLDTSRHMSSG